MRWLALVALFVWQLGAVAARASCNIIPVAAASFTSTQGGVISPITAPGEVVQLELSGCDPTAGFEATPTANEVTITFEPPSGGGNTAVVVNSLNPALILETRNCVLPGGRCRTLLFETPDTTALEPPNGLAGPARITVRDVSNTVVAEIADLNLPTLSCDKSPETLFEKFTVLPPANNVFDIENGTTTEILATVDGGNNLLIPFDYWGDGVRSVLVDRPGTPDARFLEGDAPLEAFNGGGTTIGEVISAQPNPADFLRSFTLTGRPLPPLLRLKGDGSGLYGTADAVTSVIRVAINDGMGGGDLYDVTDRLSQAGRGPIVIGAPVVTLRSPLPLRSLRSSSDSIAYARDEAREMMSLNPPDGDQSDLVVQIVDGGTAAVTNTGEAVSEIANDFFVAPAIVADGDMVAYLLSESHQDATPVNGDGDDLDNIVRVFDRDGTDLAPLLTADASASRLVGGEPLAISGTKVFFRSPGAFLDRDVVMAGAAYFGVAVSPDGADVYATSNNTASLACFSRNLATGELTSTCFIGAGSLDGASGIVVSPDGANVYVASNVSHTVMAFDRDADPNLGVQVQQVDAVNPGVPIFGAQGLAMSPDSQFLYVASNQSDSLTVFERTGGQGELTLVESNINGIDTPTVNDLNNPESVVVSPDGLHVYATGSASSSVAVFSRDVVTGALTFVESERDGISGVEGIAGATAVAISPDGQHVYVTGALDRAVAVFERNAGTGELAFVEAHVDTEDTLTTLNGAAGIAVSVDGQRVYVTARLASTLVIFRRNVETGRLRLEDTILDNARIGLPIGVAVDPISAEQVYVASNTTLTNGVVAIAAAQTLSVLETSTGSLLSEQPPVSRAAVSGNYAAFLRPESADGVDRNGDGDPAFIGDKYDDIVQVYDAGVPVTGDVISLDIAGSRVALSDSLVAFTVPEANEGVAMLNGDLDSDDDVLHVWEIGELPAPANVVNVGVSADAIAVVGDTVVFITAEADEPAGGPGCGPTIPPGGCDLDGDMDALDRVLRLYDYNPLINSGIITEIGEPAEDFVVGGSLVAFRTSEAEAGANLNGANGDTDQNDAAMQVYDLANDTLVSTHRSAIPCFLPGCSPNLPYKAIDRGGNRTVAYLTDEQDEGADLDLDGDANDVVLSMYNVRTGASDTITTVVKDGDEPDLPPFPEEPFDGTLLYDEVLESDIGVDVNEDGDLDDVVVVLIGDFDEDGTVDDIDPCRDIDTADATDDDADHLGDVDCDPLLAPACADTPRILCRAPTAAGKASVLLKNVDGTGKDQIKFKWGAGEATDLAAFGDPDIEPASYYTLCVYDASAVAQPVAHAVVFPGGRFCGKKRCWNASGAQGFKYKDKSGVPLGITDIKLTAGIDGKAKLQLKGKGKSGNLHVPSLPLTAPVTVQLVVNVGGVDECWGATFSSPQKQDDAQWKAKSD